MVDYKSKFVLAPMVRIGELPTRLVALRHGADLVWGPEIIDKKILTCERVVNTKLNTIDFLSTKGSTKIPGVTNLVFRTVPKLEENKLIFQMGTADAELAVKAANIVVKDVSGIDINAGCPKHFSIHSGMGAALLSTPDLLCNILTSLVEQVGKPNNKPISVKIRLLPNKEETLELVKRLVGTGISNLTLHCRTRTMRNRESPIKDYVSEILEICRENKVSFIINGGITSYKEYRDLQKQFGDDVSCMVAEAAEINPTMFSETPLTWPKLTKEYVSICKEFQNFKANTKYCITRMIPNPGNSNPIYALINRAKTDEEIERIILDNMDEEGNVIENGKRNTENEVGKKVEEEAKQENLENQVIVETRKRSIEEDVSAVKKIKA